MPLLSFERVSYRYPGSAEAALRNVTARLEPGQVVLLRGASGSGKSTLLRCCNGLVPSSSGGMMEGRVMVCGLDTREHSPAQLSLQVGFVFQHPEAQFIVDTVEDELAFGLENLGLERSLMRRRIEEVLDQVSIHHLRRRRISTLSGGERQRLAIAAALATHPKLMVLDEPTSQLDPQAAEDVIQLVLRLVADLGMTTLIAEHRVERLAPHLDRVWTMTDGSLVDEEPRGAFARGGSRPPIVDLALQAGWEPLPLSLSQARPFAAQLQAVVSEDRLPPGPGLERARLERVSYAYDRLPAVHDASFQLRGGGVVALMGRNGAGKTTLLKLIAGILSPARGRVYRSGPVGYVPQDADTLLFATTVADELRNIPADAFPAGAAAWRDRYPRDLSVGQRQLVAIALAAHGADLLLLDEPTRGLDPDAKGRLAATLHERSSNGCAVVVATHDVEWVARLADRVMLMADGDIYADGRPREVLAGALVFSTQINRVLGGDWLCLEDVVVQAP